MSKPAANDFDELVQKGYVLLGDLPKIEDVFIGYGTADWIQQLRQRKAHLGEGAVSDAVICELCAIAEKLGVTGIAKRVLTHAPSFSAAEKQRILPITVHVQKTISMKIGNEYVLCTGVGDWAVDKSIKKFIAKQLALPSSAARNVIINPPTIDPAVHLGIWPGMVSPFLDVVLPHNLKSIIVIQPPDRIMDDDFSISLSLYESLILPVLHFTTVVHDFVAAIQPASQTLTYQPE